MNARHRKTLAALFASPAPRSLPFRDIENLFRAIGCSVREGPGSAVDFILDGRAAAFHRPHPGKEAKPYQIRDARNFLRSRGVGP